MSSDQMPAPGKIKLIRFPPPGQEKTSNARGMPGGMLKLRFDWYIIIYMKKLLDSDWLRAVQFFLNTVQKRGHWMQKKVIKQAFWFVNEQTTCIETTLYRYGRFDTNLFRYKSKSFRYTCKVVSIHILSRFDKNWSQFDTTFIYLNYSFGSLKNLCCCFK